MRYQVVGDFLSILSYLLAYLLSARVEMAKYIFAQFFSAAIYVIIIYSFIDFYNLEALTLAYMWRYIGFFVILVFLNRRLLFRS